MNIEYSTLKEKANNELKKIVDFVEENRAMFGLMDLKLHDANFYSFKDLGKDYPLCKDDACELFYGFCEHEYDNFVYWSRENYIDLRKIMHYSGHSSKFRLHNLSVDNIDFFLYDLIGEVDCYTSTEYINLKNGVIIEDDIKEYEDETMEVLDMIANELYDLFLSYIEDIQKVYTYISDFKENQIEYFKDYLSYIHEEREYERECEEKQKLDSKRICLGIKEKYSINDSDMELLKENINNF